MERKDAYLWLAGLNSFTIEQKRKMLSGAGDIEELFDLPGNKLFDLGLSPNLYQLNEYEQNRNEDGTRKMKTELLKKGVGFVSEEENGFPERLRPLWDAPVGIFYKGRLPEENGKYAAVIGARKCSPYGREMAHFFGEALSGAGVTVISGMAMGIDGTAQTGALEGGAPSYAVLAGGVDRCYPACNIELYTKLLEKGGIISEKPPGYAANARDFPVRNRLISGLSDVVVVIEAAVRSGSLITVEKALEQGRDVFALPGRVGDYLSGGCNELLKNGAFCMTCPEDVLQYFGLETTHETVKRLQVFLTREEKVVFSYITRDPVSTDELLQKSGFPLSELLRVLLALEVKGMIRKTDISGYVIV